MVITVVSFLWQLAVNPKNMALSCEVQHKHPFVPCSHNVVYSTLLPCGKQYTDQTGQCLNECLSHLSQHPCKLRSEEPSLAFKQCCSSCADCSSLLKETKVLCQHYSCFGREVMETFHIQEASNNVSQGHSALHPTRSPFFGMAWGDSRWQEEQ